MKVILLHTIPKLGTKGTIKDVKNGFALNFLLPYAKACILNLQTYNIFKHLKQKLLENQDLLTLIRNKVNIITSLNNLKLKESSNKQGKLFGSITIINLIKLFNKKLTPINILKKEILIFDNDKQIKNITKIGNYTIKFKFNYNIETSINLIIISKE